jgi:hypothetical protein
MVGNLPEPEGRCVGCVLCAQHSQLTPHERAGAKQTRWADAAVFAPEMSVLVMKLWATARESGP